MKTTNYSNTFISVAEDYPAESDEIPPLRGDRKSAVRMQYEMISENPYRYTSDEILFQIHALKRNISGEKKSEEWKKFFSKSQPCLRSSSLGKRYGWGIHSDEHGKVAIYPAESEKYHRLKKNTNLKQLKAMRSARK